MKALNSHGNQVLPTPTSLPLPTPLPARGLGLLKTLESVQPTRYPGNCCHCTESPPSPLPTPY